MKEKGFTLIEMVIVLAVVAILAAVMVPIIATNIEQAKVARAAADVKTIAEAMVRFRQDLGFWPIRDNGGTVVDLLAGPGTLPPAGTGSSWLGKTSTGLENHLVSGVFSQYQRGPSPQGLPCWNGPYTSEIKTDPFNMAYLVNIANFHNGSNAAVFVLSAGPDRLTDTNFEGGDLANDDIGFKLQ